VPKVSVTLPCYNAAATIAETLDSLQQQTLTDFEVIIVDDGSEDDTLATLQAWAARDSRFRVIVQSHGGVITAANAAIAAATSPFIARIDADDLAHPKRLEKQSAYLEAHPEVAVVSCLVKAFPDEDVREGYRIYIAWLNSLVTNADIRREMFVESPIANPSMMVRKTWLDQMGGYQEHGWPEDYDLWLRMYSAEAKFAKIPEVLLEWRDHPNRITRTDRRYSVENFLRAKAHYLARGPLINRDAIIVWGAGMMGRRLGKQLQIQNLPLVAFVDIDPKKIGRTRRSKPIIAPENLMDWWQRYKNPAIVVGVGARGARGLIRTRLNSYGLVEGRDWWGGA
jgi:glycosyltransferase involved in cell wall biosynthesis